MKRPTIIAASDVARVFDDDCTEQLAGMMELPPDVRKPLAKAIRRLARVFIRDANTPDDDDVTREIKALHAAAEGHKYPDAAKLVAGMSKPTRAFLKKRAAIIGLTIPKPSAFLDRSRRQAACETLRRVTSQGAHMEDGKVVPHLYLPKRQLALEERVLERIRPAVKAAAKRKINIDIAPIRRKAVADVTAEMVKDAERRGVELELRSPKRKPETDFINGLQVAVYNITGVEPPVTARTADATGTFSPFVQMAQKCLELMGADDHTDAGGLINKLRARYPKKRASRKKGRKPRK
jgi:hypothetical protein